jgi:hypothetical protein
MCSHAIIHVEKHRQTSIRERKPPRSRVVKERQTNAGRVLNPLEIFFSHRMLCKHEIGFSANLRFTRVGAMIHMDQRQSNIKINITLGTLVFILFSQRLFAYSKKLVEFSIKTH